MRFCLIVLLFVLLIQQINAKSTKITTFAKGLEISPITTVRAVEGGRALLPCHVTPTSASDAPILVLFYKGAIKTPIFSADARDSSIYKATFWSDADVLGDRARFDLHSDPPGLVLKRLQPQDDGIYKCRVDYRASPTRNVRVKLEIVVPPEHLLITSNWDEGRVVSGRIGPYPEGADLTLSCQVTGGNPRPRVTWWHEGSLLDNQSEVTSGPITKNSLRLARLAHSDLLKTLTCQAVNSNLTAPLSAAVVIDLAFPPSQVKIFQDEIKTVGEKNPESKLFKTLILQEGRQSHIVCEVEGSRPSAIINWFKNDSQIQNQEAKISKTLTSGISSTIQRSQSTLTLSPTARDNGSVVSCRASSPKLPNETLEDAVRITVHYKPQLILEPGHDVNLDDIEEGMDVSLECRVDSNPEPFGILWAHNGVPLHHNASAGVLLSGGSLLLRRVTRGFSGGYTCAAANSQGSSTSRSLKIKIKFPPVCGQVRRYTYGAARNEELNITCHVESHPPPTLFRWAFNSSLEMIDLPQSTHHHKGFVSWLTYMPATHSDFGSLLCWAVNDVGTTFQPCVFNVVPASRPEPVQDCVTYRNESVPKTFIFITCKPGWNGGLTQTFTLEVRKASEARARVLAALKHSLIPNFHASSLDLGEAYLFTITAANSRGTSTPVTLSYTVPRGALATSNLYSQSRDSGMTFFGVTPFFAILIGALIVSFLIIILVAVIIKIKLSKPPEGGAKIINARSIKEENGPSSPGILRIAKVLENEKEELMKEHCPPPYVKGSPIFNKNDVNVIADLKGEDYYCKEQQTFLNNVGSAIEETSPPLVNGRLAPLASVDSLGHLSSGSSLPTSSRSSSSTVALNPDFFGRDEYYDSSLTPLVQARESSV